MNKWIVVLIAGLILSFGFSAAKADEIAELKQKLNRQNTLLKQIQQYLGSIEASQQKDENKKIKLPDTLEWAEKMKFSGDFRYRHESIDDDTKSINRDRNRVRARLRMQAAVNEQWDVIFRLATGSSDSPISGNQTLGDSHSDSFSNKEFWLDQAYADYHPASISGFNGLFGKMGNPFCKVGKNQMIFDGDLSFEGGAANWHFKFNDTISADLNGGAFWMRERSTSVDTGLFGVQALIKHNLTKDSHVIAGASYYDFSNIKSQALAGIRPAGNTQTGGLYDSDYDIFEGFVQYGFNLGNMPLAVFGSYIKNTDASTSEDTAWFVGAKLNKAKNPGSWEFSYNYRDVEKDAVVGGLNESDFIGGGTDSRGHVFGLKTQLAKKVQAACHYLKCKKNVSTKAAYYDVFQADLIIKF